MTTAIDKGDFAELNRKALLATFEKLSAIKYPRIFVFFIDDGLSQESLFLTLGPHNVCVLPESHFLSTKIFFGSSLVENQTLGCFEINPTWTTFQAIKMRFAQLRSDKN